MWWHLFRAGPQCENLQKVGAFKYRGALNAVKKHVERRDASDGDRPPTFVTHSSGNHAQVGSIRTDSYGGASFV